jgi:hypothetical protein
MVLVATKCDNPEDVRELDTASVAAAYPAVVANFSISANSPNTTRECMQVILRAIVASRTGSVPSLPAVQFSASPALMRQRLFAVSHTQY